MMKDLSITGLKGGLLRGTSGRGRERDKGEGDGVDYDRSILYACVKTP
jgi:hypothetical protein